MKKILFTFLVVCLVLPLALGTLPTKPQDPGRRMSPTTKQQRGIVVATVTVDATALTTSTSSWTDAETLCVGIPVEWSNLTFSFYGYGDGDAEGSPADATFSFDIYLIDLFGGLECVSSANIGVIGAQQLSTLPATGVDIDTGGAVNANYCWADTLTEGTVKTTSTIAYSDYLANDGLAKVKLDRHSAFGAYVRIYSMTGSSVTSVTCVMNGFSQ